MKESQVGWIKLYRKLLHSPIFTSEKGLKVWVWCLLKASHEGYEQYVGRSLVVLKPGQFVFGRRSAGGELRMKPSTIQSWMDILQKDQYIVINSTNKYSVVSINNWIDYQANDRNIDQNLDHKRTTKIPSGTPENKIVSNFDQADQTEIEESSSSNSTTNGQQTVTNKNVKEINIYASKKCLTDELCNEVALTYSVTENAVKSIRDDLVGYVQSTGKRYKDYKATLQNWVRRALKDGKIKKYTAIRSDSIPKVPELTQEQRIANRQKIAQIKAQLSRRAFA